MTENYWARFKARPQLGSYTTDMTFSQAFPDVAYLQVAPHFPGIPVLFFTAVWRLQIGFRVFDICR